MKTIKKINIIIVLIFIINILLTGYSLAIGNVFSAADDFLGERKCGC